MPFRALLTHSIVAENLNKLEYDKHKKKQLRNNDRYKKTV